MEPREGDVSDSKSVFKVVEKDGVVDGVEGSGKIEKCEKRCFTRIRCEKERLQRVEEVVAYEMIIELT